LLNNQEVWDLYDFVIILNIPKITITRFNFENYTGQRRTSE